MERSSLTAPAPPRPHEGEENGVDKEEGMEGLMTCGWVRSRVSGEIANRPHMGEL